MNENNFILIQKDTIYDYEIENSFWKSKFDEAFEKVHQDFSWLFN